MDDKTRKCFENALDNLKMLSQLPEFKDVIHYDPSQDESGRPPAPVYDFTPRKRGGPKPGVPLMPSAASPLSPIPAVMPEAAPLGTADDFMAMNLGDGSHELVRGTVMVSPPAEYSHGYVCLNAGVLLYDWARRTGSGHVASNDSAVPIDAHNVRGADISYYSEARWPRSRVGKERPPVAPDVVVEVLSEGNRPGEMLDKIAGYLRAGVGLVIVLDPKRRLALLYRGDELTPAVLDESATVAGLPELPGFSCAISEFFD